MSQLGVMFQESETRRTILFLLRDKMDGVDSRRRTKWKTLTERLGFNGMGCCGGPTWGFTPPIIRVHEDQEEEVEVNEITYSDQIPVCLNRIPDPESESVQSGMTLAAALAAERQLRATSNEPEDGGRGTPARVSLMKLIKETDSCDEKEKGSDTVCCVCMVRNKAAAFIPCGHTFCGVCSRELWLNRGSCPLCNRLILEILDIYIF